MDADSSKLVTVSELTEALKKIDFKFKNEEEINNIVKEVDFLGNGLINITEFIAATMSAKDFLTEEKLWVLFKQFDVDDSDYITADNIKEAFKRLGRAITE